MRDFAPHHLFRPGAKGGRIQLTRGSKPRGIRSRPPGLPGAAASGRPTRISIRFGSSFHARGGAELEGWRLSGATDVLSATRRHRPAVAPPKILRTSCGVHAHSANANPFLRRGPSSGGFAATFSTRSGDKGSQALANRLAHLLGRREIDARMAEGDALEAGVP